jgi:hypothetical protein
MIAGLGGVDHHLKEHHPSFHSAYVDSSKGNF